MAALLMPLCFPLQDPEVQKHATQILRNMLRQEEAELQVRVTLLHSGTGFLGLVVPAPASLACHSASSPRPCGEDPGARGSMTGRLPILRGSRLQAAGAGARLFGVGPLLHLSSSLSYCDTS